jgi:predicted DNA-binding transcriptional regulator YafY
MRADRLLTELMLLQTRGRMTARELAVELEVSERTIYRDVDALAASGVPVFAERGPGGGCALLDSYRTTLTGLKPDEIRALFMLNIPAPLARLGVSDELRAALLKLTAALPASKRGESERARRRILLDSVPWSPAREPLPDLQLIHRAVWEDRRLIVRYRRLFDATFERVIEPYGLVAKTDLWYLVANAGGRVFVLPLADILAVRLTEEHFERPPHFDLAAFWAPHCAEVERDQFSFPVTVRVSSPLVPHLRRIFGARLCEPVPAADSNGPNVVHLAFESLHAARDRLLDLGSAVQVLEPEPLRRSMCDYAEQILAVYYTPA